MCPEYPRLGRYYRVTRGRTVSAEDRSTPGDGWRNLPASRGLAVRTATRPDAMKGSTVRRMGEIECEKMGPPRIGGHSEGTTSRLRKAGRLGWQRWGDIELATVNIGGVNQIHKKEALEMFLAAFKIDAYVSFRAAM